MGDSDLRNLFSGAFALACVLVAPVAAAVGPLPATVTLYPQTSSKTADGARVDFDLHSEDPLETWTVRYIELVGPKGMGSLLAFEAGAPGFVLDGGSNRLPPGASLTGLLPIPVGLMHLDLTVRVHARSAAGTVHEVDTALPAHLTSGLSVLSSTALTPGPPSAAQAAFFAEWKAVASKSPLNATAAAYRDLKVKRLAALGGTP